MARTPKAAPCSRDVGAALMRKACAKHGVPPKVTDPAVLAKVAGMVLEVLNRKARRSDHTRAAK